jgi:hypothetical protein
MIAALEVFLRFPTEFSPDRMYRYRLTRYWENGLATLGIIGLNPSVADEMEDDRTIRRCIRFAKDMGYGSLMMCNLFAFCATEPKDMKKAEDPVGFLNDMYLKQLYQSCHKTIAAWGTEGGFLGRDKKVREMIPLLDTFGLTKHGFPRHPLYLPKETRPTLWV